MNYVSLVTMICAGATVVGCSGSPSESGPISAENTFSESQGLFGSNVIFDTSMNGGRPLNYQNSGCLISRAVEGIYAGNINYTDSGDANFDASGNLDACIRICQGYQRSFTTSPAQFEWKSKYMDVNWNDSTGEAHFTCVAHSNVRSCFSIGSPPEKGVPDDAHFVGWEYGRICL